ncbi:MAG: peptide synthase [Elusimicrobia bacterium GWA2_69_24]|nr:MAG: peptide synthase [Elusimicrobia bacterium GWA2_69_24]
MAGLQPDALAIAFPQGREADGKARYGELSFRRLDRESNRLARGLARLGISRGTRTSLMVPPGPEFFSLTFALFKLGAVPVLIDPGIGLGNLKRCLAEAEPEAFIGTPKAHAARLVLGWARATLRTCVTVGPFPIGGGWTLADARSEDDSPYLARTRADDDAAILFTSGSTGSPKGAVYTHGNFTAQVEALRRVYGIEPGEIDLPTFPLFALFAPALGMSAVIPDMDATRPGSVDPERIIEPIRRYRVTQMFGSPALIDRVGRHLERHGVALPTLRRVISAGAPVPARTLARFAERLPAGTQVFTPYGATEALPVCSIGSDELLNETVAGTLAGGGVCLGKPVPGIRLEIIRVSDDPIPSWSPELVLSRGETGEIAVSGPVVTRLYRNRPEATALAKIPDPTGGFFHRMGDLGRLDEQGRVWFCGRKSQRVRTTAGTLYTICCEAVFNAHPQVFRTALVGVESGTDIEPVLCVELEADAESEPQERIRAELLALGAAREHTRAVRTILFHPRFPVDIRHNAKIFREELAVWAAGKLS